MKNSRFHQFLGSSPAALLAAFVVAGSASSAVAANGWWNTTNGNWTDVATWWTTVGGTTAVTAVPGAGQTATFNGTGVNGAETIYLNGNQAAASLTFGNTGTTTILGGASATPAVHTLTLSGGITVIAGAGAVTIGNTDGTAAAKLALSANLVFQNKTSNVMTANSGITSSATSGTQWLTLNSGGSNVSYAGFTFNEVIGDGSSGGQLAISINNSTPSSVYTFNQTNTFSGGLTVAQSNSPGQTVIAGADNAFGTGLTHLGNGGGGGIVQVQASGGARSFSNNWIIDSSATQSFTGANGITISGTFNQNSRGFASSISGGATLTLSGTVYISSTDIAGQTATLTGTGNTLISGVIQNNAAGTNTNGSSYTFSNSGVTTLSGANTYTGGTSVTAGALTFLNTTAKPATGTTTVAALATLGIGVVGVNAFTSANVDSLFANTLTNVTMAATSKVGIDTTNGDFTYATSVAGSPTMGLVKLGANTLTLSGSNTYTGVTTLTAGTLSVGTIGDGGIAGNLGKAASAASNLVFDGGTLAYTGATATSNRAFTINAGKTATINTGGNNLTLAGAPGTSTTGALTKTGAGTLSLSGTCTYTGATTVAEGYLALAAGTASPITVQSGAFIALTPGSTVTSTAALTLAAGSKIKISGSPANGSYTLLTASSISGTPVLETVNPKYSIAHNGTTLTLVVSPPAYYLDVDGATAGFGSPSGTINASASSWTTDPAGSAATGAFASGGQFFFGSSGSYIINADVNNFTGVNITTSGATVTLGTPSSGASLTGSATWTVATGSTLIENFSSSYGALNWSGATVGLNGGGTITFQTSPGFNAKSATITQNMTGAVNLASGWTGGTSYLLLQANYTLAAGTLNFSAASASGAFNGMQSSNKFSINGGTIDNTSGSAMTFDTSGAIALSGQYSIAIGGDFAFTGTNDLSLGTKAVALGTVVRTISANANTLTIGGVVSGTLGGITKAGNGTLTLSGANSYTGATTVSAGTLAVTGSLGATAVTVSSSATLAGNGNIGGNVTIGSGARHALAVAATTGAQITRAITGTLTMTGSILDLTKAATPADGVYVLATATTAITGTPTTINYNGISGTVSVDSASSPKRLLLTVSSSPYNAWANGTFVPPLTAKATTDNQDSDSLNNLQEYAFGTSPTVSTGEIVYLLNGSVTPGAPKTFPNVPANGMYSMVFGRRADYVAAGLTYTVQFSANLNTWADNNDTSNPPVQVGTDSTINAMSVPYPDFITTTSGTQKPTYSRVKVELAQ